MRVASALLLVHLLVVLLVPGVVVVDFLLERRHIERDLCVQRMVPEEVRTCHGQCYLMRQLNKVDQREKDLPTALRDLRLDDMLRPERPLRWVNADAPVPSLLPVKADGLLAGHCGVQDPVPWA